jgi:hypothetical protein
LEKVLIILVENELVKDRRFKTDNGCIIDTKVNEDLDGLIQCNNCGNVWDGNAQCLCYDSDYD